jgi:hypothetical protein
MVPAVVVAEPVSVRLAPLHIGLGEAEAVTEVGVVLTTDTVTDAVLLHDNVLVPVTV